MEMQIFEKFNSKTIINQDFLQIAIALTRKVLDTFLMEPITAPQTQDYMRYAMHHLRAQTASEFEALETALQMLALVKLHKMQQLPLDTCIEVASQRDFVRTIDNLEFVAGELNLKEAFTDISKLQNFDVPVLDALIRKAIDIFADDSTNRLAINDLLPQAISRPVAHFIPSELSNLLVQLGEIPAGASVYTPWDLYCTISVLASEGDKSVYLETPIRSGVPYLIRILTDTKIDIRNTDPIIRPLATNGATLHKFDTAIAFPPFGSRFEKATADTDPFKRFPEKTSAGAILSVRHLLSQTERRIVVAVPNNLLFSAGAEKLFREDMIQRGVIRTIIGMPEGVLNNTSGGFAVIVLEPNGGNKQIRFIDASDQYFSEQIGKTEIRLKNINELFDLARNIANAPQANPVADRVAATITNDEIQDNDFNLEVNRYVLPESQRRLQQRLSRAKTVSLGDIFSTVRPVSPSLIKADVKGDEDVVPVFEIGAMDLPEYGYIKRPNRQINLPISMVLACGHQFLQPKDIVLIVKGSVGKVGIVPDWVPNAGANGWVVGQSGIVLRSISSNDTISQALFMFLRSPLGKALLEGIVSGATTPLIQLRQLLALRIVDMTQIEQKDAIAALTRESELQEKLDQLHKEQAAVASHLWQLQ